tara:strand:+ start:138 stop:344 length:207 start_codon:yes stop_codon:yes gene_type:complete
MSDKKIRDLENRMTALERKLDFFMNANNLSEGDRTADLNERVRDAMESIANHLKVSLYSLYDDKERKR